MSTPTIVRSCAPGRTELAGNHTDHQGGCVIAAAISCDVYMEAQPNGTSEAHVESEGFPAFSIDLTSDLPRAEEVNTTAALVRGIVAGMRALGVRVGGFDLRVRSTVPSGGGLSSSAAFELALAWALLGLDGLGDANVMPDDLAVRLAKVGQVAERDWFGKSCGLMDQLAVALGGVCAMDFSQESPRIERLDFDFSQCGYALCLVDAHCDHSRYTHEYSQVPRDMAAVAAFLGEKTLSQVGENAFRSRFAEVRATLGDVPALRALHYFHESRLVDARADALRRGDFDAFLHYTRMSGASSAQYLQNVSVFNRESQPAMIALGVVDALLAGEGACRIHGGGFGGTIQAFVPLPLLETFNSDVDELLGKGSCQVYQVGCEGAHLVC